MGLVYLKHFVSLQFAQIPRWHEKTTEYITRVLFPLSLLEEETHVFGSEWEELFQVCWKDVRYTVKAF